jgi:hypothetical protein
MKEEIYMVKETGEILLWTNQFNCTALVFWYFMSNEDSFIVTKIDESLLEYIGEL